MFIGTALKRLSLGSVGYGLLVGWLLFVILCIFLIEYGNKKFPSQASMQANINLHTTGKQHLLKTFFRNLLKLDFKNAKGFASNHVRITEKGLGFPSMTAGDKLEKFKIAGFFFFLVGTLCFGIALVVIIAKS